MVGALPRQTDSLHEVGMATILGKHLVVRAAARIGEHDAINAAFNELSQDERARLERLRKRHRAVAVFLHEVGHCLGAIHENDARSLMNRAYDPKMSGSGDGAVALMRVAFDTAGDADRTAVPRGRLAVLEDTAFRDWVTAERDLEVTRLKEALPLPPAAGHSAFPAAIEGMASPGGAPPELSTDAQARFARAQAALRGGGIRAAYDAGSERSASERVVLERCLRLSAPPLGFCHLHNDPRRPRSAFRGCRASRTA
jgi:hypothetical protein